MRMVPVLMIMLLGVATACTPGIEYGVKLEHANARAPYQTDPRTVLVFDTDVDQAYDVLGDLEVVMLQRTSFGVVPTRAMGIQALQQQAGRIGAHAIILVSFGEGGIGLWSNNELRGHARAIRFR
jgi:hypothetical protein